MNLGDFEFARGKAESISAKGFDKKTLEEWKSKYVERDELLRRKCWLLLHHSDFFKELGEFEQAAGKRLPDGAKHGLAPLPYEKILFWESLRKLDPNRTSHFIVKYDLKPHEDWILELAKLRKIAKDGKWQRWKDQTFARNVWWYDLRERGHSVREIVDKIPKHKGYDISTEFLTLVHWQNQEHRNFKKLCQIAGVQEIRQNKTDKLKLLYFLDYPKIAGVQEIRQNKTDKLKLLYLDYAKFLIDWRYLYDDYEWPDDSFEKEPELRCNKELKNLRDDYTECRDNYLQGSYSEHRQSMIRKAIADMKRKIDQLYLYYQQKQ